MADRSVLIRLRADVSDLVAKSQLAKAAIRGINDEIDKSNDRTAWLAQGILALLPAVTRLGAGAVPVLSGIATQLTIGVAAAGTAALAFNGVGDALGALNDYQLAPTEANLAKLNETMAKIGPDGQAFVEFLDSLGPAMTQLSNSARGGVFPGVMDGIEDFMTLAPQLNDIVREIGEGIGELTADAGAGLSSDRAAEFFDYLETRAKPILVEMGRTLGNFTLGFMNMLVAFDPLTDDFSKGLLEMSRSFAAWSEGLSSSTGFQEFLDYVREAGPDALDFLGSLVMALVELAEAAAPVGAVMLPVLTGMLDVLGDLAGTPLGPLAIGFLSLTAAWGRLNAVAAITGSGVMSKATAGLRANVNQAKAGVPTFRQLGNAMAFSMTSTDALTKSSWSYSQAANRSALTALQARTQVQAFGRSAGPIAGQIGLLALAMSDYDDRMGLSNTTALALAGTLLGPWGAAAGATAGLLLDMKAGADAASEGFRGLDAAIDTKNIDVLTKRIAEAKAELTDQEDVTGFGDFFSDAMRDLSIGGADTSVTGIYTAEIEKAEAELAELKNTRQDVADDKSFYNSLQAETAALEANIQAMREKRAEALRGLNAELDYKASILDARDALKENGQTVNENTRAGQANLRTLYGMASAWNQQDDAAKNATGSLRNARANFIELATAMGMGEDKARRLSRELFEIPTSRKVQIQVDSDLAFQRLRAFKASIDSIDRNIVVGVSVVRGDTSGVAFLSGGVRRSAGGTVPGQRYPYGDKVTAELAPGEEVVANDRGQADMNRYALKAASAGAKLAVLSYATGGTVGDRPDRRRPRGGEFAVNNTAALQAAIDRLTLVSEDQTKVVDRATTRTEEWSRRLADVAQATVAGFNTGLFEESSSPWSNGAGSGPIFNINKDIAGLQERDALQRQLAALGLDGDALAEILTGTNEQISGFISSGQASSYEALFNQRAALQSSVGAAGGQLAYGAQYAAAQADQRAAVAAARATEAQLVQMNGELEKATAVLEQIREIQQDAPRQIGAETGSAVSGPARNAGRRNRNNRAGRPQ